MIGRPVAWAVAMLRRKLRTRVQHKTLEAEINKTTDKGTHIL